MRAPKAILGGILAGALGTMAVASPLGDELASPDLILDLPVAAPPAPLAVRFTTAPPTPVLRAELAALQAAARTAALTELAPPSRPLAMVRADITVQSGYPLRPHVRIDYTGVARWDALPQAEDWSQATLAALRAAPHDLVDQVPRDIATWCPGYATNPDYMREAFWVGMISALARHESTFNPRAMGGGGQWIGLLQIYPPTADHFGCGADSVSELQDPEANLACAARIMSVTVRRDNAVALLDGRWRGVAADWGPMTEDRKRADMIAWTSEQDYCQRQIDFGAVEMALLPLTRPWADQDALVLARLPEPITPVAPASRPVTLAQTEAAPALTVASFSTRGLPETVARPLARDPGTPFQADLTSAIAPPARPWITRDSLTLAALN